MKKLLVALGVLLLLPSVAAAQSNYVWQSGAVTPGHPSQWITNGVIGDGGTPAQGKLTGVGVTASGPGICQNSGPATGPYNQLCLTPTSSGGGFSWFNYGGATGLPTFNINGTLYPFPFTSGGVLGPSTTVVGDMALWNNTTGTLLKDSPFGVFNVRQLYGAVPDGSTDNSTAIANAFTATNSFTSGIPTIYFDCNVNQTTCVYNYGGSGTSPINPTIATSIVCAPGVTLNYTGSAHAADIGPTGLTALQPDRYTIQGCRWTGGASYTAGLYFNTYIINSAILFNTFINFGNQTGYSIVYSGNNWEPLVLGNFWYDTDGTTRNMLDAHTAQNGALTFVNNATECVHPGGTACSIVTTGVGLWFYTGRVYDNVIQYHYPAVLISSCQACGGGEGIHVRGNHFEGNSGGTSPAITFGNPGGAAVNISSVSLFDDNFFYWPSASGVSIVGPNTPASGSYTLGNSTWVNNYFSSTPSGGGAFYINTNGGVSNVLGKNTGTGSIILSQSSTPPLLDTGFAVTKAYFLSYAQPGSGSLGSAIAAWDANGVNLRPAYFHSMVGPLSCSYAGGSGTTQTCTTSPEYDPLTGSTLTPVSGDVLVYKTATANSGSMTINVNGTGAAGVKKYSGTSDLSAGDIQAGISYLLTFDGTNWEVPNYNSPGAQNFAAPLTITSASANALAVGLNGATNPAFNVNASTASQAAGLNVTGAATGGTVAIAAIDSGNNTNLSINAKGTGTISIGSVSTGAVTVTPNTQFSGQIIPAYGTPTIASGACGATTNGSIAGGGTNQSGQVQIGSATTTTCTISFSTTLTAAPLACQITAANAAAAAIGTTVARVSSISTSAWVITGSALANANYYYQCI